MLDGYELAAKLDAFYDDWTKWYSPSEEELKQCQWMLPNVQAKDGIGRSYDPINRLFRESSSVSNREYYYKETGGNMTQDQVNAVKESVMMQMNDEAAQDLEDV